MLACVYNFHKLYLYSLHKTINCIYHTSIVHLYADVQLNECGHASVLRALSHFDYKWGKGVYVWVGCFGLCMFGWVSPSTDSHTEQLVEQPTSARHLGTKFNS